MDPPPGAALQFPAEHEGVTQQCEQAFAFLTMVPRFWLSTYTHFTHQTMADGSVDTVLSMPGLHALSKEGQVAG